MLRLLIIPAACALALAQGGSLANLARLDIRLIWLAFAGFFLQVVLFTPIGQPLVGLGLVPWLYVVSMLLIVAWTIINRRLAGMPLVGLGVLCNTLAIAANGGYMPVSIEQAQYAGTIRKYVEPGTVYNNSILLASEDIRLWFLTDILAIPAGIPFANVVSIGDLLLTAGLAWLCYRTILPPQPRAVLSDPVEQNA